MARGLKMVVILKATGEILAEEIIENEKLTSIQALVTLKDRLLNTHFEFLLTSTEEDDDERR